MASIPIGDLSPREVEMYWLTAWAELVASQEDIVTESDADDPPTPLEECLYSSYVDPETGMIILTFEDPNISGPGGVPLRWYPEDEVWEP